MIGKKELLERLNEISNDVYIAHNFVMELNRMIVDQTGKNIELYALDGIEGAAAKLADLKLNIQIYGVGGDD